ncbi:MAG: hypothetical protein KC731_40720 [Myxococcales bacterium]|nr:hypothetical protein [Myxococcales bacterium]
MAATYAIQTVCECQAILGADLDENRQVMAGWAVRRGARAAEREKAPASSIGAAADRFDVAWQCPFCGRNPLRTFHVGALRPLPAAAEAAEASTEAASA